MEVRVPHCAFPEVHKFCLTHEHSSGRFRFVGNDSRSKDGACFRRHRWMQWSGRFPMPVQMRKFTRKLLVRMSWRLHNQKVWTCLPRLVTQGVARAFTLSHACNNVNVCSVFRIRRTTCRCTDKDRCRRKPLVWPVPAWNESSFLSHSNTFSVSWPPGLYKRTDARTCSVNVTSSQRSECLFCGIQSASFTIPSFVVLTNC